jgi:hypothetical protein
MTRNEDGQDQTSSLEVWSTRAEELVTWTENHLVIRRDAWLDYYLEEGKVEKRVRRGTLTRDRILYHFKADSTSGILSLFTAVRLPGDEPSTTKETMVDIDNHDAKKANHTATWKAATNWYKDAVQLGFHPILEHSSINSYHLRIIFGQEIAASRARALGCWLTKDWRNHGLEQGPEIFPKQDNLAEQGSEHRSFGSAVRLFGRNPAFPFWSAIYNGKDWLSDDEAIDFIVNVQGDDPGLIPAEAIRWKEDRQDRVRKPRDELKRDLDHDLQEAKRALTYLDGDIVDTRATWLRIGFALFDLGEPGLPLWEDWSRESTKFKDGECRQFWTGFHAATSEDDTTIATLFYYAKQKGYRPEKTARSSGGERLIQSEILLQIAAAAELFHDPSRTAYAAVPLDGHTAVYRVRSLAFRRWLRHEYLVKEKAVPAVEAVHGAIETLDAQAVHQGLMEEVHLRTALGPNQEVLIDLGDPEWRVIEVTPSGWRILDSSPVRFRRSEHMRPLPEPARDGKIDDLKPFVNLDEDDFLLFVCWMVAALYPSGPYMVLALGGESGSGKTTCAIVARSFVDPNEEPLRSPPRTEEDIAIAARHGRVIGFNNLSGIPPWLSDALCRITEGTGLCRRKLYEDDEETLFSAERPAIITAIEEIVTQDDLKRRSLIFQLAYIKDVLGREDFRPQLAAKSPTIFGALLDILAGALARRPAIAGPLPLMAVFARLSEAASQAMGNEPGHFLRVYEEKRQAASEEILASSVLAETLRAWHKTLPEEGWEDSCQALLDRLSELAPEDLKKSKKAKWPKSPRGLSAALRRLLPSFRMVGIIIEFRKHRGESGKERTVFVSPPPQGSENTVGTVGQSETGSKPCKTSHGISDGRKIICAGRTDFASEDGARELVSDGCPTVSGASPLPTVGKKPSVLPCFRPSDCSDGPNASLTTSDSKSDRETDGPQRSASGWVIKRIGDREFGEL